MEAENGGFQIHLSGFVAEQQRRAVDRGQGKAFAAAFRQILRRLRKDPHSTGEPLYHLPNLRLEIRSVVAPLAIQYAVSGENPHVYIKSGMLLSER